MNASVSASPRAGEAGLLSSVTANSFSLLALGMHRLAGDHGLENIAADDLFLGHLIDEIREHPHERGEHEALAPMLRCQRHDR